MCVCARAYVCVCVQAGCGALRVLAVRRCSQLKAVATLPPMLDTLTLADCQAWHGPSQPSCTTAPCLAPLSKHTCGAPHASPLAPVYTHMIWHDMVV